MQTYNVVAYFSFRALNEPPTNVFVLVISLIACAPLEVIEPRLCPGSEIFLAPPLDGKDDRERE